METKDFKKVGWIVFWVVTSIFLALWAMRCRRDNYWLIFLPLILVSLPVSVEMYGRFIILMCCRKKVTVKGMDTFQWIFFVLLLSFVGIYLLASITTVTERAQTYFTWSQAFNKQDNTTMSGLKLDGCYGPKVDITNLLGEPSHDWVQQEEDKKYSLGLIPFRQLYFKLNRPIASGEQWNCLVRCTTVFQADVPCIPIRALVGVDAIDRLIVTPDYRIYSDATFITLIIQLGLQSILWTAFVVCKWTRDDVTLKYKWMFFDWPADNEAVQEETDIPGSTPKQFKRSLPSSGGATKAAKSSVPGLPGSQSRKQKRSVKRSIQTTVDPTINIETIESGVVVPMQPVADMKETDDSNNSV